MAPTAVVSGRVDEQVKRAADAYISRSGLTNAEVISAVWNDIARTGRIPVAVHGDAKSRKAEAAARLSDLRDHMPRGTALASMTDEEIAEELHTRD